MSSETLLVTGGSGLVGNAVCRIAIAQGRRVRALVRRESDIEALKRMGAEPVSGDVTDPSSLQIATAGATEIIHTAALLGGTWATAASGKYRRVNYEGTRNVLQMASHGARRTVVLATGSIMDKSVTVTETSPMLPISVEDSPYVSSKRAAFYEAMLQASLGQDVVVVVPGGVYGPEPLTDNVLRPTSFNSTLVQAITGRLREYVAFPISWAFVDDVARVTLAALDRGRRGARYLATGCAEDVTTLPGFCNRACEISGVSCRVDEIDPTETSGEFGPDMAALSKRQFAEPLADPTRTMRELGIVFTPLRDGLRLTVRWLRDNGQIPV